MLHTLFTTVFRNISHFPAILTLYNGFGGTAQNFSQFLSLFGNKLQLLVTWPSSEDKGTPDLPHALQFLNIVFSNPPIWCSFAICSFPDRGLCKNAGRLAINISARLHEKARHQPCTWEASSGLIRMHFTGKNRELKEQHTVNSEQTKKFYFVHDKRFSFNPTKGNQLAGHQHGRFLGRERKHSASMSFETLEIRES